MPELWIAGYSNPQVPDYLQDFFHRHAASLKRITFLGYVNDEHLPQFFRESTIVVTTSQHSRWKFSHLALRRRPWERLGSAQHRTICWHERSGMGIVGYEIEQCDSLARVLLQVLADRDLQLQLAKANFAMATRHQRIDLSAPIYKRFGS